MATDSGSANDAPASNPTPELVDFIYRDNPRIASLTAQLFGGHLISTEVSRSERKGRESSGGFAAVVTGSHKGAKEKTVGDKETRAPHDAAAADLIASLAALGRISDDVRAAKPGAVIRAEGTLHLLDGAMVNIASAMFEQVPGMEMMAAVMRAIQVPGAFVLRTNACELAGTLDAAGLHEPIGSTYLKHGGQGIAEVGLIGIRELSVPAEPTSEGEQNMLTITQGYGASLRGFGLPESAIRIAPIAIYRKLR